MLFEEEIYPCESDGGDGGGEKLVVRAEASIVGGLGVWLGLCRLIRVSEKKMAPTEWEIRPGSLAASSQPIIICRRG